MKVLGISGSLRQGSYNTSLLRAAAAELPPEVDFELFDGLREVPPYDADQDTEPGPEAVEKLRSAIAEADAVLFSTPEYNHSIPGVLKNAVDWASRPFPHSSLSGKSAAVIGASASMFGAIWAQAELRKVLGATGANVLDEEIPVGHAQHAFDEDGGLRETTLRERLAAIVAALVEKARAEAPVAAKAG
jgi:chromate reductase